MKLIRSENKHLVLSNDGENVALLIERRDSDELKQIFARLMLENYSIFEIFLKRLNEISGSKGLPVPFISSDAFTRCEEDPIKIGESYVHIIKETCPNLVLSPHRLYSILEEANIASLGKRTEKMAKGQLGEDISRAIDIVNHMSKGLRPVYDERTGKITYET